MATLDGDDVTVNSVSVTNSFSDSQMQMLSFEEEDTNVFDDKDVSVFEIIYQTRVDLKKAIDYLEFT